MASKLAAIFSTISEPGKKVPKRLTKHLGTAHDQQTHGRRKVAVGGKYPDVENPKGTGGRYSEEARRLAAQVRAERVKYEPQLTDDLLRSLESHGAKAYGLAFRIKTEKSIARKIDANAMAEGKFRSEVAKGLSDIIRYTGVAEEGKYAETIWKVLEDLRGQGITPDRIKNFWPKGDPYDGINIKMVHPAGFKFELQFHTPASIETKNKSHKIYDLYREEADTRKRWTYYNRMVRLWAQVNVPSGALEIGEQVSEQFVTMTKAAYRTIQRLDDNDNVVAEYRFSDANQTIVEQRKTSKGWVDAHGEVVWYLISGTWDYEPSSEAVAKHLGTAHDQTTHGRRKTATGLSAVREAARGTELEGHQYNPNTAEGQLSFFTDEPYSKPAHAEYETKAGKITDKHPMPKTGAEAEQLARDIFDLDIELKSGEKIEVRVTQVDRLYETILVKGRLEIDGEYKGDFERFLYPESGRVVNNVFRVANELQGKGIGTSVLRHWEDQYARAGIDEMTVTAMSSTSGMNGAYTWAKYGYEPDYGETQRVAFEWAEYLAYAHETFQMKGAQEMASVFRETPEDMMRLLTDRSLNSNGNTALEEYFFGEDSLVESYYSLLEIIDGAPSFAKYLKNSDIKWNGSKYTSPLYLSKASGYPPAVLEVINRWMTEDPAGLENDDPQFWSDIRAAFKKVKKDNPTVNSVHVASVMGSKKKRKKKRGISGMVEVDKGDYPGHPFRGNQWVGGIPEGGGKGKAPSYEKGKGKTGGKKAKEEAPKRKVASFATMAKLVPKSKGDQGVGLGHAQNIKSETSKSIAAAITAAGVADTPEKAHQIALELQDLVQQNQVIYPFPAFKAGRATPVDGPQDYINAETLASGVLRAWADSSSNPYSMVLQLAALHSLGVIDDYEGVNLYNQATEFTDDRDIFLDPNVGGSDSVIAYDEMRERFPKAMEFVEAVVKAQYEATQQKFKEAGVTHITVSRGITVTKQNKPAFMEALKIDETSSESLEQDVGILSNISERPLSSWTADTGKAIEFAVDYGTAELGSRMAVMTAVVPVELAFSTPQTGLGSPIESEVVLLSGNYNAVAFVHDEDAGAWPSSATDIEDMVTFATRSGDIGKADRPKESIGAMLNEGKNADWIKALAKRKRKKMSKKEPIKDPKGGLTAAGRRHFKRKEGANLKPGVKGKADTPEKMRRKGSFLTRFYTNPSGPLQNDKGEPTRLALAAAAWGEPVPKNRSDAAKLAAKGRRLLERYENVKKHAEHNQKTHGRRDTAASGLSDAVVAWVGAGQGGPIGDDIKAVATGRASSVAAEYQDEARKHASALQDALKDAPKTTDFLHRGLTRREQWKEGDEIALPLESATPDWDLAYEYATGFDSHNQPVAMVRFEPGAPYIDGSGYRAGGEEGITGGKFKVARVDRGMTLNSDVYPVYVLEHVGAGDVSKHGGNSHDQKTHGRRKTATGGGIKPKIRRITEAAGKRAKQLAAMARDGGFTFNPKRSEMRSKGVAVAVGKENERKVRVEEFSEDSIRQYAREHAELLAQPRHHLGAWRETEKGVDYIYLDVSVVMPSLESAADLGRANDQIGIFDLSTFTTHYRAPDKEGNLKYIPLNLTDATGYDRTAATDMATNVGKADGDKGVMFVPGEMLDESSLPKIVERIMALKPVGKGEKESRKNP